MSARRLKKDFPGKIMILFSMYKVQLDRKAESRKHDSPKQKDFIMKELD